jgi:sortase A
MRAKNIVLNVVSFALIGAGIALIASFFFGSSLLTPAPVDEEAAGGPEEFDVPVLVQNPKEQPPSTGAEENKEEKPEVADVPEDKTLTLTVSKMSKVQNKTIPTAAGTDEQALKEYAAIHLEGTGFPWEKEANVYVAGHRLGYPNTESFLAFWDLDRLEAGDEIEVRDSNGKLYTYRVFKEFIVGPTDISVTEPVEGKNILTLQTCTLPDYSQRLVVQAEKVA